MVAPLRSSPAPVGAARAGAVLRVCSSGPGAGFAAAAGTGFAACDRRGRQARPLGPRRDSEPQAAHSGRGPARVINRRTPCRTAPLSPVPPRVDRLGEQRPCAGPGLLWPPGRLGSRSIGPSGPAREGGGGRQKAGTVPQRPSEGPRKLADDPGTRCLRRPCYRCATASGLGSFRPVGQALPCGPEAGHKPLARPLPSNRSALRGAACAPGAARRAAIVGESESHRRCRGHASALLQGCLSELVHQRPDWHAGDPTVFSS